MIIHLLDEPTRTTTTSTGVAARRGRLPFGAVAGLLHTVAQMLEGGATHLGVATGHVIESFRNDLWPGYKTGEGIDPRSGGSSIRSRTLAAMGVVVWAMVELEADDGSPRQPGWPSGTRASRRSASGRPTGPRAVSSEPRRQVDRRSGQIRDMRRCARSSAFHPSIPDYLALVGDAADGFPGMPGIGPKTAAQLIGRYGPLEDFPRSRFAAGGRTRCSSNGWPPARGRAALRRRRGAAVARARRLSRRGCASATRGFCPHRALQSLPRSDPGGSDPATNGRPRQ
jgi:hypothetical protein